MEGALGLIWWGEAPERPTTFRKAAAFAQTTVVLVEKAAEPDPGFGMSSRLRDVGIGSTASRCCSQCMYETESFCWISVGRSGASPHQRHGLRHSSGRLSNGQNLCQIGG
jgi:hypothetical protein